MSVSAPRPRAKQLTAAFWVICFERNPAIPANLRAAEQTPPEPGHPSPSRESRGTSSELRGAGRGGSSAPSPPIIWHQAGLSSSVWKTGPPRGSNPAAGAQTPPHFADGGEPGRILLLIQVRTLSPGVAEVKRCSEGTDPRPQFPTLMSYLGACAPLVKSDLHESLGCLTGFVNAPAPLGPGMVLGTGPKPGRDWLGPVAVPGAHTLSPSCFCRARWTHAVCL